MIGVGDIGDAVVILEAVAARERVSAVLVRAGESELDTDCIRAAVLVRLRESLEMGEFCPEDVGVGVAAAGFNILKPCASSAMRSLTFRMMT